RIDISEDDFLVLHASRIDNMKVAQEKGVLTLIQAMSQVKDREVKLLLAAAPTAPFSEEQKSKAIEKIMQLARLNGIEKRLVIKTFSPEEMPLVYNGADLFVMASHMEAAGLVYAEAMASGLPTIGTAVGGIPEVIESGRSGELVPP